MQRPRRTSEFHDEGGRQARQQRSTVAPSPSGLLNTGSKYSAKQSRIARPNSLDRGVSNSAYLSVPQTSARGVTPQKTPLTKQGVKQRVLFTAEKQRNPNTNVPLHNDKKWIQEQTQRITEHLLGQANIAGVSADCLSRGLRQISTKQFVAIINYFLSYVWGTRYTVGANYVDDIIGILQKLNYPHAVNKSWLKTPNTQHSFGNVIMLFDFFMDFLPPQDFASADAAETFELQEPLQHANSSNVGANSVKQKTFHIPDVEFQSQILRHAEEGFALWDKDQLDELKNLQKQTCDIYVQKTCNFQNIEQLDAELQKLESVYKQLKKEMPAEDRKMMKTKSKLESELKSINHDIRSLQQDYAADDQRFKQLTNLKQTNNEEVAKLEMEKSKLLECLAKQRCTVEQRNQMVADVAHFKQLIGIEERTAREFQNRQHNQQVLHSRALKQVTDQVESFNSQMRDIVYSDVPRTMNISLDELSLPLHPKHTDLQRIIPLLYRVKEETKKQRNEIYKTLQDLQQYIKKLTDECDTQLETKLCSVRTLIENQHKELVELEQNFKEEHISLNSNIQQLQHNVSIGQGDIERLNDLIKSKKYEVEFLKTKNENTVKAAEEKHEKSLAERKVFLEAYEIELDRLIESSDLQAIENRLEHEFAEFEKEFKDIM